MGSVVSGFGQRGAQSHTLTHHPGLLLLPNAKTALMRSPRIARKIKVLPRSPARRTAAGIRLGRGAARPVGAAAPGGSRQGRAPSGPPCGCAHFLAKEPRGALCGLTVYTENTSSLLIKAQITLDQFGSARVVMSVESGAR